MTTPIEETEQKEDVMTAAEYLLHGVFPQIRKMGKKALQNEVIMWRRLWDWTPPEVRYYVARVATPIALTARNYKRLLGTLQATHWSLDEVEIKAVEKVHDYRDGNVYFEKKTIRVKTGGIQNIAFIHERKTEAQIEAEANQSAESLEIDRE